MDDADPDSAPEPAPEWDPEWLPGDLSPLQGYLAAVAAAVVAIVAAAVAFPTAVYDRFVWKYFWGPVYADAHGETCAYLTDGGVAYEASRSACATHPTGAVVGYNTFNEVGYAVILLTALLGLVLLLRHLDIGETPALFFGLFPFMFLGGALRVVEDAANAARLAEGVEPAITYPLNALLISPVIYFTVFFFTVAALLAARWAEDAGHVERYDRALAGIGTVALAATLLYLLLLAFTTEYVSFLPQFTVITLVATTVVAGAAWWAIEAYAPHLNAGTGRMGLVIIWGQTLDGVANVVGLDWGAELGLARDMIGKHPVNRFVVDVTGGLLPPSVVAVTGDAWPFLLLKVVVAVAVVALFDEAVMDESPRYSIMMLVAILAVGLGPGSRDMLRATFAI